MRVGFSGHQWRTGIDWNWVKSAIGKSLSTIPDEFDSLCSLAAGADQLFARCVTERGGRLITILPRDDYESFFDNPADLSSYRELLQAASEQIELHDSGKPEESFFRAGAYITEHVDALMVVWDGKPAQGFGGTADIVRFAEQRRCPVLHINPVSREIRGSKRWPSLFS